MISSSISPTTNYGITTKAYPIDTQQVKAIKGTDFACFKERLFIGNKKAAYDNTFINQYNITHIVNCALGDCPAGEIGTITYHNITLADDWIQSISPYLDDAIAFINKANDEKGNVLIHCEYGVSRSVAVLAAYIMTEEGICLAEAIKQIQSLWYKADPSPIFKRDLIDYGNVQQLKRAERCSIRLDQCFSSDKFMEWPVYQKKVLKSEVGREIGYTENGNWGRGSAGVMVVSQTEDSEFYALLLCRSSSVEEPDIWSTPGGARKETGSGDLVDPLDTALIELKEEAGLPSNGRIYLTPIVYEEEERSYHTYILALGYDKEYYIPKLNWEHTKYRWFTAEEIIAGDFSVHAGVKFVIKELQRLNQANG